jgi:hypothetical protein
MEDVISSPSNAMLGRRCGNASDVDQHVVVTLVIALPRAVAVLEEHGHLADEPVGDRDRELGHDGPVIADPALVGAVASGLAPPQVAKVDGDDTAWSQRLRDRDEGTIGIDKAPRSTLEVPSVRDG